MRAESRVASEGKVAAVVFPGQGSQIADMRDVVERERPDLVAVASELVGEDPFERVNDATRFAQPAIYCASIALWERLGRPSGDLLAGHSLGEVTALVAAGALSSEDGLRVVAERGRLMQEAAEASGEGGMMATRASRGEVEPVALDHGAVVANVNDPRQVVLSGGRSALAEVASALGEAGIKTKLLPLAAAFHSPAIARAVTPFRSMLDEVEVGLPRVPVLCCATAAPFVNVRAQLSEALTRPVLWLEVMRALHARGVRRFIEPGPGRVLTGLIRRSLDDVEAEAGADLEAVQLEASPV